MQNNSKKRILIIANSRFKGGSSGSDKIYESFERYWPCIFFKHQVDDEFRPFILCYIFRIFISCIMALFEPKRYHFVYTSSDFLPDCLCGFIFRLRGVRWVSGFYLKAPRENKIHYYTQKLCKWLIDKYADAVIVTNPTMFELFPNKKITWMNGGVDMELAGLSNEPKIYDAVWVGRIHYTKGIDELCEIWKKVIMLKPDATLAIIGDGDMGIRYIRERLGYNKGVTYFGYMGDERYKVYKQSKVVLYTTPQKYDHFSMAPVEAMACGCPMLTFDLDTMTHFLPNGSIQCCDERMMANEIIDFIGMGVGKIKERAYRWASQFDYKKQSLRTYNELMELLYEDTDNRGVRDNRNGSTAYA